MVAGSCWSERRSTKRGELGSTSYPMVSAHWSDLTEAVEKGARVSRLSEAKKSKRVRRLRSEIGHIMG
ncbi:hypothetical protein HAX54_018639 [Datura stramonium]|uniref:Uncharacterized protein n=1 Tax=Datura stramonium TaxID=4076 RepID=A0ABS8UMT3_DATST|nr:hypothetical protein [Datura stramonium]